MKRAHFCDTARKRSSTHHLTTKNDKKSRKRWHSTTEGFRCHHCQQMVFPAEHVGTSQRNHCPHCLWSCHVDTKPGNRASSCHGGMEPVGLTFKHNGFDKYGRPRTGDVLLIHHCHGCGTLNLNRIAGDDCLLTLLEIFEASKQLHPRLAKKITDQGITLLTKSDKPHLLAAIYGKSYAPSAQPGAP